MLVMDSGPHRERKQTMNQATMQLAGLDPEVENGVSTLLRPMIETWDAGDATAYARLFTDDATYVMFLGMAATGRAEIERMHEPLFTQWQKGSRMRMRVLDARQISPDVVVVLTEGGVGAGESIPFDKVQTLTLVRTSEGWRCAAFQNTTKGELPGGPPR
jgi:uncharacterized protein (TIGR02246 family)